MTARDLILFPDPRLKIVARPVEAWDERLRAVTDDVLDTLRAVSAIGLTAPHIGEPVRIVVIRLQPDMPHIVYVNPVIVEASDERAPQMEGSVSMPGITESIERAERIRVRYRDLDGIEHEEAAEGFAAACLQHEIDQLDGIFWIERLTRLRRERALKRFAKLKRVTP
ncbi:peptide deformylase [Methylobacterium haplocladii]|uniref:Peptide deformylase-like n=1 Tax=Methylobacterium haplocladii TaxID=1176176 RepID=A0A512ILQ0_9HYPH|nr:peptide deformylase [Methylobacterium haplocladii]GEO98639.1 peptide deformylase-like protein [Methylobacterium haplocladii]GJD83960.1 Peptide deformylase [Methylobacterium haplocladii]GLS59466.1 peptide deformylase-like protein [Methylobacterium haplocladii]